MSPSSKRPERSFAFAAIILSLLVICSLCVRVFASSVPGFGPDLGINSGWAHSGVRLGLAQSYREQLYNNMLPDHPPISIIAYTFIGQFYFRYVTDSEDTGLLAHSLWIRMPAIGADLITLVALFLLAYWARGVWHAFAIGVAQTFHPGGIGDSAIWGQIDAVFTMWIVLSLFAFSRKWWVIFAMCYMLAILSKAQALAILPFMAYLLIFRVPFWGQVRGVIGASIAVGVILSPFAVGGVLPEVMEAYTGAVGQYSSLSMNAFNMWWLLYPSSVDKSSVDIAIGLITFRTVGLILFAAFSAYAIWLYHLYSSNPVRSKQSLVEYEAIFGIASLTFFCFFTFNTEMHERYLFPAVVLMLPLLTRGWRLACATVAAMLLLWLNIAGVHRLSFVDAWFFDSFPNLRSLIAFFIVLLCAWYFPLLRMAMFASVAKKSVSIRS